VLSLLELLITEGFPFRLVRNVNIRHYGVMKIKKLVVALLGALILFSCGELPELKPIDWGSRLSFSGKPYTGSLLKEWNEVDPDVVKELESHMKNIGKYQRWKGSGKLKFDQQPVYFILSAKSGITVTIDWRYRGDESIVFAYKRVGAEPSDYGFDVNNIALGKDDYLVIRISLPADVSDTGWELGFTVK
jgi:hypothetical protein